MKNKAGWEQTRAMAYATSVNKVDITFPWEKKQEKVQDTAEEREQVRREMKAMEKELNKK